MKRKLILLFTFVALLLLPAAVLADEVPSFDFASPLFGLATAPDNSLLVADAGAGIIELRHAAGSEVVSLPGVADVAPIGRGVMFALTGGGEDPATAGKLYRVSHGNQALVADLLAYEAANNPDGGVVDSNPFDVAALGGNRALVVDAGGNDLLIVDERGTVDWVATFPVELASTANLKDLLGCPEPALPEAAEFCLLPPAIPTEAVPTSIAIGPDGAYYVGELKGFPGPVGVSKVWRIEPGTLHAQCGISPACSVVYDNFTSVIDLAFGPDGTLYVVEFDEASFAAAELSIFFGLPPAFAGGTINACDAHGGGCTVVASPLLPTAVAVDKTGTAYATVNSLIPGMAEVIALP